MQITVDQEYRHARESLGCHWAFQERPLTLAPHFEEQPHKRLAAAWDDSYLQQVLLGQ